MGDGEGQFEKGAEVIQGFCKQVQGEVNFEEGDEVSLNIKRF